MTFVDPRKARAAMFPTKEAPLSGHVADMYDELQTIAPVVLADLDELVDDDAAVAFLNEAS